MQRYTKFKCFIKWDQLIFVDKNEEIKGGILNL